ncbi:hypothetical protein EZI54_17550 [Marinobacter halodurans]|uniref:Prepilin-type N-terminal cleavage/methylation domain-containing protein n=1 Tax=Marinobacter halodurans TaxID=2528979 RepID=A0ABY1ZK87_9GAMM|nr:PilW family protein [Marinobacter halodurans]TBW50993.1 hypothetical protein EZI54_17550 [Marinobacter halodurans]
MIVVNRRSQAGLSLVEIMVALTLGLILTAGLIQLFVSNQRSFSLTAASGRVQESGRMASELLSKAIRNADYWGCAGGISNAVNNLDPTGSGYNDATFGFKEGLDGTDNADGSGVELAGTDSFIVRGVGGDSNITITKVMEQASANLHVNDSSSLADDDIVYITDCRGGDIFQATNVNASNGTVVHNTGNSSPGNYNAGNPGCPGSNAHCLSQVYDEGASIYVPYFEQYYIAAGASGEPALFMRSADYGGSGGVGSIQAIELIEGIEDMQILYGEDLDGDYTAEVWRDAGSVSDMGAVVALRVSLLSRSQETNVAPDQPDINFFGKTYGGDGRLRRQYTITASIRNRIGG